jgi:hypothetical protein
MSILTTNLELTEISEATRTYKISNDKIQGYVDNIEALKQSIDKRLNTEQCECPIYSFDYGISLDDLIGKDSVYVKVELKRRIKECLLKDDRIQNVDNFIYSVSGDTMTCTFDVVSIYGTISTSKEVAV